jgi:ClpP class serine protease
MKDYLHLRSRVIGVPLFVSQTKLEIITEAVLLPIVLGTQPNTVFDTSAKVEARSGIAAKASATPGVNDLAMIDVYDSLQAKGGFGGLSGFTTYESIRTSLQAAVREGFTNILLNIDSPGGEVVGLFALTEYIRGLQEQGINLYSYIDGSATSAAFAIAAATSKRFATNTSLLGSIAAIMVHVETSKADATAGRTYTIFRSKEQKALGDSHTELSADVKAKFQTLLDNMDTLFNNDVLASMPNLSLESIIAMKGSEFIASDALQLGLIDEIVTGVDSAIEKALQNSKQTVGAKVSTKTSTSPKGVKMNEDDLKTALLNAQMEIATLKAEASTLASTVQLAEQTRVLGILAACQTHRLPVDLAIKHISRGFSADSSLEVMTDIAEERAKLNAIDGATGLSAALDPDLAVKLAGKVPVEGTPEERKNTLRAGAKAAGFQLKTEV